MMYCKSVIMSACLVLASFWLVGCESDGGDDTEDVAAVAGETTAVPETSTNDVPADPNFPDGLHPSSSASKKIASLFERHISPVSEAGGNDTNTVVCIGDSITESYYTPHLDDMTEMNVVNAGKGGERSGGTASRTDGVLSKYRPAYLCILTGANDISGADASPEEVAANVESIINKAKANNTIPIVGTLTPLSGSRAEWADDARAASAAIRAVAGRTGAKLADLEAAF